MANEIINAKYNELSEKIPTLTAGTYDLTVDCTEVDNETIKGFGNILKTAQEGVNFNITPTNIGEAITDTSNMFSECKNLTSIDTSNFLNVTNATNMLSYCDNLEKVIWGGSFRPTTNNDMFYKINKLVTIIASIDSEKWIVDNATSMSLSNYNLSYDFDSFKYHLDDLNVKSAELRKDRDMWKKKAEGSRDKELDIKYSELDTEIPKLKPYSICNLTVDCTGVDPSEFVGSDGSYIASTFWKKLNKFESIGINLILKNIPDTVTDMYYCFLPNKIWYDSYSGETIYGTSNLLSANITNETLNVTNAYNMFENCSNLTSVDTSAFTNVTDAESMFQSCSSLTEVTGTSAFTKVTNAINMFNGCSNLTSIDTSGFTKVTDAYYMFESCSNLTSIDTSAFTNVTDAEYMFQNCSKLTSIAWGDSFRPTNFNEMFSGATAAKTITASADSKAWIEARATDMLLENYTIVLK